MRDVMELGSSPYEEDCVQVEKDKDYLPAMRKELQRYKEMLQKRFPFAEHLLAFRFYPRDFGQYGEVVVRYDPDDEQESGFAFFMERNTPARWDDDKVFTEKEVKA